MRESHQIDNRSITAAICILICCDGRPRIFIWYCLNNGQELEQRTGKLVWQCQECFNNFSTMDVSLFNSQLSRAPGSFTKHLRAECSHDHFGDQRNNIGHANQFFGAFKAQKRIAQLFVRNGCFCKGQEFRHHRHEKNKSIDGEKRGHCQFNSHPPGTFVKGKKQSQIAKHF